jgi:hypothetical protein
MGMCGADGNRGEQVFSAPPPHVQNRKSILSAPQEKQATVFAFGNAPRNPAWSGAEGALPNWPYCQTVCTSFIFFTLIV